MPDNRTGYLISVVDEDPLRSHEDACELLAAISEVDPTAALNDPPPDRPAALDVPAPDRPAPGGLADVLVQGGPSPETVGLLLSAGSFVAALVQVWLARVPQRSIVVKRPDGATLHITGRQAREDDTLVERFLSEDEDDGSVAG